MSPSLEALARLVGQLLAAAHLDERSDQVIAPRAADFAVPRQPRSDEYDSEKQREGGCSE